MSDIIVSKNEGFGIFTKLMSGFAFVLVLTGLGSYYSYTQMNRLSELTTKIYDHPLRVTRAVLSADTEIVKIHRSMKDLALATTQIELESAISFVNRYEKKVYQNLAIAEKWIIGDEGAQLLAETVQLFRDWKAIRDQVIALTQQGNQKQAFAITKGKGADHVDVLNSKMGELKSYAATKASDMLNDSQKTERKILGATATIFGMVVLLSALFGYLLSRTITDSIKILVKGLVEFGQGNLDYRVDVKFKDEIGWLSNAFNEMAAQRKKVVEQLRFQSEIMTNMAEGVYLTRVDDGLIVYANPKIEEMVGYAQGELIGKPISIVNAPSDQNPEETAAETMDAINETGTWQGEIRNIRKDGTVFWCYANISTFKHVEYGRVIISVQTDITKRKELEADLFAYRNNLEKIVNERTAKLAAEIMERKQVEEKLHERENRFRQIVMDTDVGYFFIDKNGIISDVNRAWVRLYKYSSREEIIGKHFALIQNLEDLEQANEFVAGIMKGDPQYLAGEFSRRCKDGSSGYHSFSANPVVRAGEVIGIEGFIMDSTQRKLAEDEIRDSLKEKETLLQEIHHRVKNNMQVISSLLKLQSNVIKDDRIKKVLLESQNRVKAMATVHENLYKSKNLSSICILPFLRELAESIIASYQLSSENILLEIDSDEIQISIEQASPLGLIVNELVSNSLKHAFPDGHQGKISIKSTRLNDGNIQLQFTDNGVGIPESLDWRNTDSMGLKLLVNLAENQLDGSVKMKIDNGTGFIIKFKEDDGLKG